MATSVALVRGLQPEERQEVLEEDDEMPPPTEGDEETDAPMERQRDRSQARISLMAVHQKNKMFEEIGRTKKGIPSKLTEAQLRAGMATASSQVKNIRKLIRKSRSVWATKS